MFSQDHRPSLYIAAGIASISVVILLFKSSSGPKKHDATNIIPSPLETYTSSASPSSLSTLPYPPHSFIAGARDLPTPYGSIRLYELGPVDASRKVVLLHGISTPCISLSGLAHELANKGCRVLLFDLFGRGYSDGPADLPYDNRLYATQVLLAITSSEANFTSNGSRFSLIGYSLGGCLAADFASWFPHLVDDLVLIAPGGLQNPKYISWRSKIIYSQGWLPESWLQRLVYHRLRTDPGGSPTREIKTKTETGSHKSPRPSTDITQAVAAEVPSNEADTDANPGPKIDVLGTVAWQVETHKGFVPAFMSSIRFCPIYNQAHRWSLIGARLSAQRLEGIYALPTRPKDSSAQAQAHSPSSSPSLRSGAVLLILGRKDDIVIADELIPAARAALGGDSNLRVAVFEDAAHEVPITHATAVAATILECWAAADAPLATPAEEKTDPQLGLPTPPAAPAVFTESETPTPRAKELERRLREERAARALERGDARRELEIMRMEKEASQGELERLRKLLTKEREKSRLGEAKSPRKVRFEAQDGTDMTAEGDDDRGEAVPEHTCQSL